MKFQVETMSTRPSQPPGVMVLDEQRFAEWCVKVCGGGFTTLQTTRAMDLHHKVRKHGSARLRDFIITRVGN